MPYPLFCPECGLDLTSHAAVTEVQEMYNQAHVNPDSEPDDYDDELHGLVDEQKEIVGENVRAFCENCGHQFYNKKDEIYFAFDMVCASLAKVCGLDLNYVHNDALMQARDAIRMKAREQDDAATAGWNALHERPEGSDAS